MSFLLPYDRPGYPQTPRIDWRDLDADKLVRAYPMVNSAALNPYDATGNYNGVKDDEASYLVAGSPVGLAMAGAADADQGFYAGASGTSWVDLTGGTTARFLYSMWLRTTLAVTTRQTFMADWDSDGILETIRGEFTGFGYTSGHVGFAIRSAFNAPWHYVTTATGFSQDEMFHIGYGWDGTDYILYLHGRPVVTTTGSTTYAGGANARAGIGRQGAFDGTVSFTGQLADFRVYTFGTTGQPRAEMDHLALHCYMPRTRRALYPHRVWLPNVAAAGGVTVPVMEYHYRRMRAA